MTSKPDDILDDLFHSCAWAAFIEEAALCQGIPSSEPVRIRAYRYFEESLRTRNSQADDATQKAA